MPHQIAGYVDRAGYRSELYSYSVQAVPGKDTIMGEGWKVDNFYRTGESETARWLPKEADEYETTYRLDLDGDGKTDEDVDTNRYDLKLTHAEHDGVVSVRMIPVSTDQGQKRLSVLVRRYVESISGAGHTTFSLDESEVVIEKRYAASIERESKATIAGLDAYVATIAIKNVDQLRMDPKTVGTKVEVVFAHMPFRYMRENSSRVEVEFPVVMVAAYFNRGNEFEEGLADFRGLLNRVVINGKTGASIDYGSNGPLTKETTQGELESKAVQGSGDAVVPQEELLPEDERSLNQESL